MTRAELLALFLDRIPDNTAGAISEGDVRDTLNGLANSVYLPDEDELPDSLDAAIDEAADEAMQGHTHIAHPLIDGTPEAGQIGIFNGTANEIDLVDVEDFPTGTDRSFGTDGTGDPIARTVEQDKARLDLDFPAGNDRSYGTDGAGDIISRTVAQDWTRLGPAPLANGGSGVTNVPATLTYGATMTPNLATALNWNSTLTGNGTLGNPTNQVAGQGGVIVFTQDATGSRTLSAGSNWLFPGGAMPDIASEANAKSVVVYYVIAPGFIAANLIPGVAAS